MEQSKCLRVAKWNPAPSPIKSRATKLLKYPCVSNLVYLTLNLNYTWTTIILIRYINPMYISTQLPRYF